MSDLAAALQVAIRVHAGQCDKQGQPYLLHVLRVVEAVSDEAKVVAALHDVIEDGPSAEAGRALRWLDYQEMRALDLLTRNEGQTYQEYIKVIAREAGQDRFGDIAREVKIADLRDNLQRIPPEPVRSGVAAAFWMREFSGLKRRYERAIQTLEGS